MLVIGIDPGSVNTGFAWIRGTDYHASFGGHKSLFSTSWRNTDRMPLRWCRMRDRLEGTLKNLPEPPDMVVIEEPSRERCTRPDDRKSLMTFFGAYAVIAAEISRQFRNTVLVPISYVAWTGGLSKPNILMGLQRKYSPKAWASEDESDAVGLADFAWGVVKSNRRKVLCSSTNSSPSSEPPSGSLIQKSAAVSGT